MLKRSLHHLFYLLAGLLVAAVIVGASIAWRLSKGPLSLSWAVPTLEQVASSAGEPFRFAIGDVIVSWTGWDSGLDVRFLAVDVLGPDDRALAQVPELSVALSADALRSFRIAPTEIHLFGPRLSLVRREDGTLEVALAEGEGRGTPFREALQEALATPRDPADPYSYLDIVTISDGRFVFRDLGLDATWSGRLEQARLVRREGSMSLSAGLSLLAAGEVAAVSINGIFAGETGVLRARAAFENLRPSSLAAVNPALDLLLAIDLPLSGSASFTTRGDGRLASAHFDVRGGDGRLVVTPDVADRIGRADAAQSLGVDELGLAGRYDGEAGVVTVRSSGIAFAEGTALRLPEPMQHTFPMSSIAGQGSYDIGTDALSLASLDLDLGGPKVSIEGRTSPLTSEQVAGEATIFIGRVKVDELATFWPTFVARGARTWALDHLSGGAARQGEIRVAFGPTARGTAVTGLTGSLDVSGVGVDYRPPAPPIRNTTASVAFDLDGVTVAVASGESNGLRVTGGTARIVDARSDPPLLDLDLAIEGAVPAALTYLAGDPFGYTRNLGFSPKGTQGNVAAMVRLELPLRADPALEEVKLAASADVSNLFITGAFLGGDVTGGTLRLDLDEKAMTITGPAAFEGLEGRLGWHEVFRGRTPYVRRIDVTVPALRLPALRRLKPEAVAMLEQWVDSPLAGSATVTFKSERDIDFDADIDATEAALAFPPIGWAKDRGRRGFLFASGRFAGDRLVEVRRASISAPALEALGSVNFAADGRLQRVILDRLISGKTDASAIVTAEPATGWDIVVGGKGLDLEPVMKLDRGNGSAPLAGGGTAATSTFTFSADLDRLWLEPATPIRSVTATVVREADVFKLAQVAGVVGAGAPIGVEIAPAGPAARTLRIRATDAGEALRALDIFPDIEGGRLTLNGTFDDSAAGRGALDGMLKIRGFRLIRAPIIARILNVMALTGILDALRGRGISFAALDAPFTLRDDVLSLDEARMHGNSIGLTAAGTYDLGRDLLDLRGTLVPFYVLNSLLGNLPLVGGLFSGGERGGGLFAASYSVSGTMAEPSVSVNPISVLAPGMLRNVFRLFETTPAEDDEPPAPAPMRPTP